MVLKQAGFVPCKVPLNSQSVGFFPWHFSHTYYKDTSRIARVAKLQQNMDWVKAKGFGVTEDPTNHRVPSRQVYFSNLMSHQNGGDAKTLKRCKQQLELQSVQLHESFH